MKFNNENSQEQMTYVAPKSKVFEVQIKSALLQASYGEAGAAGAQGLFLDGEGEEDY